MEGVADGVDGGEGPLGGQRESVLVLRLGWGGREREREMTSEEEDEGPREEAEMDEKVVRLKSRSEVSAPTLICLCNK